MLEILREKASELLNNTNDPIEKRKLEIIKEMLKNDKCFFEIDIETAYSILKDLKIDNIKEVYSNLIDIKNFNN